MGFITLILSGFLMFFLVFIFSFGFCLLTMGISGCVMNKILRSQTEGNLKPVKKTNIICAVVLGVFLLLAPFVLPALFAL
jgi:hypothetical protein